MLLKINSKGEDAKTVQEILTTLAYMYKTASCEENNSVRIFCDIECNLLKERIH